MVGLFLSQQKKAAYSTSVVPAADNSLRSLVWIVGSPLLLVDLSGILPIVVDDLQRCGWRSMAPYSCSVDFDLSPLLQHQGSDLTWDPMHYEMGLLERS